MKRFSIFLSLILVACICRGEKKQYATQLAPGELYFVTVTNVTTEDLEVTGTLSPDATGTYSPNGTYEGSNAYERADGAYWIFWDTDSWWISDAKGSAVNAWYNNSSSITSLYSAGGTYDGTATASYANSSAVWTNNETYMWYPAKAIVMSQSAITSTNTMQYVVKHTTLTKTPTAVVTNEFGNIQTNQLHGIGTDVNTFITNTIATWTNSASARSAVTPSDDYIQPGDIIRFTFSNTNVWLKLIGRR